MAKRKMSQAQKNALAAGRKKRLSKFGLSGLAMPSTKTIGDALMTTGIVALTFLAGKEIERKVFKGEEQEGIKRFIGTAVKGGLGVVLATQNNKLIKVVGTTLIAEAAIDGVSKVMNKDLLADGILNGLDGFLNEPINGLDEYENLPPLPVHTEENSEDTEENDDDGIS